MLVYIVHLNKFLTSSQDTPALLVASELGFFCFIFIKVGPSHKSSRDWCFSLLRQFPQKLTSFSPHDNLFLFRCFNLVLHIICMLTLSTCNAFTVHKLFMR